MWGFMGGRGGSCSKIAITWSIFEVEAKKFALDKMIKYKLVRGVRGGGFRDKNTHNSVLL